MKRSGSTRWLVVCVLVGLLVVAALGAGTAGAAGTGPGAAVGQQSTPTNETVRHEDPDAVEQQGDLGAVERYLAGRLAERIDEGSASISRGEYEAARSVLGEEYDDQLARYADVAGETAGEDDDAAAESFESARNQSRSLTDGVESFEATDEAYREASARGNEALARALARQLLEDARSVDESGRQLDASLDSIERTSERDVSQPRERVRNVTNATAERSEEVAAASFVRTRVVARAAPSTVSFLRPTTVRGQVLDENGSPLSGRTVRIGRGSDAVDVSTNGTGAFVGQYRPVRLPANATAVPVTYVPRNESSYLGNRTNVTVSVEPVTPTVTASSTVDDASYGERVTLFGSVAAENVTATGTPVEASIAGVRLGGDVTGVDGGYVVSSRLPATAPAGDGQVEVRVNQTGRAVDTASTAVPLSVEPTDTVVTLNGTVGRERTVAVAGRLHTVGGRGIGEQRVHLRVGARLVDSVRTTETGRFATNLSLGAAAVDEDGVATVTAVFDGAGTNLGRSEARATVRLPAQSTADGTGWPLGFAPWQWLAVAVLLAVGAFLAGRRWNLEWRSDRVDPGDEPGTARGATGGTGRAPVDPDWRSAVESLLASGKTDRAVETAYGVARGRLARELEVTGALTHWEFYAAVREDGVGADRIEALRSLTEAFERARFAPAAVSASAAENAVAAVDGAISG